MDERDRERLAEELVARLRQEGVPGGAWLLNIEQVRSALQDADDILRRLADAIIASASSGPRF